jgi:hypothetical protein
VRTIDGLTQFTRTPRRRVHRGHGRHSGVRRRVVRLRGQWIEQAGARGGVDDGAVGAHSFVHLTAPVLRGPAAHREGPFQLDRHNVVELRFGQPFESFVDLDGGVVDHRVQVAELRDGQLDHVLGVGPVGDAAGVGHRPPAPCADLVDHRGGDARVAPVPVDLHARVVHDHVRAAGRQVQRLCPADPPSGTGHQHRPSSQLAHHDTSLRAQCPPTEH